VKPFVYQRGDQGTWIEGSLLHVYVVIDLASQPGLARLAHGCRDALASWPISWVADKWLHITLLYAPAPAEESEERPDLTQLRTELRAVRRSGVALNLERSERGVVAVGRGVTASGGDTVAAVSVSMPGLRYSPERVKEIVATLASAAEAISAALCPLGAQLQQHQGHGARHREAARQCETLRG
jgi:hypothetical protein